MNTKTIIILVILGLSLAACAPTMEAGAPAMPAMEISGDFGAGFDEEVAVERAFAESEKAGNFSADQAVDSIQRMVIKNADLSIVVENPLEKLDSIAAMADQMGGFVVDSRAWQNTLRNGAKVPHANITIRVPAERLEEAMDTIKTGVGEITNESVSGQDVTKDYTDLQSRLGNLEAAEEQLQEIMDEARQTEDVLQVYNNLINVREQIEVIKGQMEYYEDASKLSRITVDITGDEEAQPLQIGGWEPAGEAKDAIEAMVNALQWLGDVAIWVVLCVVPIGIIVGIPLFFGGRYLMRLRKRFKKVKVDEVQVEGKNDGELEEKA